MLIIKISKFLVWIVRSTCLCTTAGDDLAYIFYVLPFNLKFPADDPALPPGYTLIGNQPDASHHVARYDSVHRRFLLSVSFFDGLTAERRRYSNARVIA